MTETSLRPRLLEAFASPAPTTQDVLKDSDIVAFGPESFLASFHLSLMIAAGARVVLCVDDFTAKTEIQGVPVVRTADFIARAGGLRRPAIVDFTSYPLPQAMCRRAGEAAGVPVFTLTHLQAAYDGPAVYQTVRTMRELTLRRADDWLALANRLADDFSRETLYAALLLRLQFDRNVLRPVNLWGRDEYFGVGAQSETFVPGNAEHFVDCGAHRGTVIQKLLGATGGRYASLHAFEPDEANHAALAQLTPVALPDFHPHKFAVSDRRETLRFSETGTMASHVSAEGNVSIEAVRIDDFVEHATFVKMDVEGYEPRALRGAERLIANSRPRLAIASYHYADDLLDVVSTIDDIAEGYTIRMRQHYNYFYDSIIYASPRADWLPVDAAR
ncbi:FkbM family methyltransferase [Xylophilus sp. GOD-11R]|uniref:FkbM family methyltransferase n=1 Tax=Xylophilus sp. GOD-11R TaxID=3089814 RepID=UPI00298C55AF|nr:FkbM family methyltransferase [Xylophilus sp. GOD-11R]WPB57765.1 FkbM family methyltransferase [Xylophilus sp. GOD-11R]